MQNNLKENLEWLSKYHAESLRTGFSYSLESPVKDEMMKQDLNQERNLEVGYHAVLSCNST